MNRRLVVAAFSILLLSGTATLAQVPAETTPTVLNRSAIVDPAARFDYSDFDVILNATVVGDKVDYLAIRRDWWPQLNAYLDKIATFDADTLPPDEKLALYLNLYNATMIRTIIERFHVGYSCAEDNKRIFNEPLVRVGNKTISLNYLEHKLIRGSFRDPRVHAAMVCGGLGCPPLARTAYRGDLLQKQLDDAMTAWATDSTRNVVNDKEKTVVLSKLFRSYAADFGGEDKAIAAVDKYHPADFSKYKVTFDTNYDWTLNILPPRYGKWVSMTQTGPLNSREGESNAANVRIGEVYEVVGEDADKFYIQLPFQNVVCSIDRNTQVSPYPPAAATSSAK